MTQLAATAAHANGQCAAHAHCRYDVKVVVLVEGANDVQFLKRISLVLHQDDPAIPDLATREACSELLFVPIGGSDHRIWLNRLAPLNLNEFHLFDRDVSPLTEEHQAAVDAVNRRQNCIATLTGHRHVENYLHPDAIFAANGIRACYGSDDDVAEICARCVYQHDGGTHDWDSLTRRKRRQYMHRAKRWLNTDAVSRMTPAMLDEQDPEGDVRAWLEAIDWLTCQ